MGDIGSLAIGGAMAGLALLSKVVLLLPILGGLYVRRDAERDRAGHLVPRLPPPGAAHGADPPPLRGRRLARVHGDRAVLAVRRRVRGARPSASSTPTSSTSPGSSTDARPRDRASGRPATPCVALRTRRAATTVTVVDDRPLDARAEYARVESARAARRRGARRRRPMPTVERLVARRRPRRPEPGRPRAPPRAAGRARAPASPSAPRSTSPPSSRRPATPPDRGSSPSPAPTARRRSRR